MPPGRLVVEVIERVVAAAAFGLTLAYLGARQPDGVQSAVDDVATGSRALANPQRRRVAALLARPGETLAFARGRVMAVPTTHVGGL